jgi:hypothetical protein
MALRLNPHIVGLVLASSCLATAADADGVMPSLNVQLRFLCLSLSDSETGAIEAAPLASLGSLARPNSVKVTTTWNTLTNSARSEIVDAVGSSLIVTESVATAQQCRAVPINQFKFTREGAILRSTFCITTKSPRAPFILADLQLRSNRGNESFLHRIGAAAACYPSRGLNLVYDGVTIDHELVRTE